MSDDHVKNPFQWFDGCYVLSDPITRRQAACRARLQDLGIHDPHFDHARCNPSLSINNMRRNPPVEFAVNLGHIKNVVRAIKDGRQRPLFLEDDAEFMPGASRFIGNAIQQLPANWSVLYLGGHPREPIKRYSQNLVHAKTWSCAEGYAVSSRWLGILFDFWCDRISSKHAMYDFILGEFAAMTNEAYCVYPIVTQQPDGWSFIGTKTDSKKDLIARGWSNNLVSEGQERK